MTQNLSDYDISLWETLHEALWGKPDAWIERRPLSTLGSAVDVLNLQHEAATPLRGVLKILSNTNLMLIRQEYLDLLKYTRDKVSTHVKAGGLIVFGQPGIGEAFPPLFAP
jgi:hypothetical protein